MLSKLVFRERDELLRRFKIQMAETEAKRACFCEELTGPGSASRALKPAAGNSRLGPISDLSLYGCCPLALTLCRGFLVELALTELAENPRFLADSFEAAQGPIEVFIFTYTNARHLKAPTCYVLAQLTNIFRY